MYSFLNVYLCIYLCIIVPLQFPSFISPHLILITFLYVFLLPYANERLFKMCHGVDFSGI